MKFLVVDDDEGARLFLNRLLTKKFPCEVLEAGNGLEALMLIQERAPDLVITDVQMPILDGAEMLAAIRSDPSRARIPVIVMSVVHDKHKVTKLIQLGITDYILKPLWSDAVYKRVSDALSKMRLYRQTDAKNVQAQDGSSSERKKLLIVDKDIHFRNFCSSLLSNRFEILEAGSGAEGLQFVLNEQPEIVCLGEALPLMSEDVLANKIQMLDLPQRPIVVLCSTDRMSDSKRTRLYDGVVKKTFVPEAFLKEFTSVVLREESLADTVLEMVRKNLSFELITATQQTIGVMTTQEAHMLDQRELEQISKEMCATVDLVEETQGLVVTVGLMSSEKDILSIAAKILGAPTGLQEGAADAFGELANTIGGRIRSSLETRGVHVQQQAPRLQIMAVDRKEYEWELAIPFRTEGGETYAVGIAVETERVHA